MADNNKKRTSSFRKLFPSLFFSHKSKEKNSDKESHRPKNSNDSSSISNHYQNPRSIIRTEKSTQGEDENNGCIYENIAVSRNAQHDTVTLSSTAASNHSSSSTLVSESVKGKSNYVGSSLSKASYSSPYTSYAARPQVPPKPHESHTPQNHNEFENPQYPDVYYHSVEKLTDKISHFDEIEIYRASKSQVDPTPVGAEIKKVSTKFLISPKKEAEVRTIQPTRARSLSFNKNKAEPNNTETRDNFNRNELHISKPYNYSAPTSPIPLNHKIPNMPKTVSPYEHVRKTIMENEIKRNSLSRSSIQNKSTPSPRPEDARLASRTSNSIGTTLQESHKMNDTDREKTRQRVEAFYWQKLKEQKDKEDEYLLRQSLNCQMNSPTGRNTYSHSNCSTPNSFTAEPRSFSLPRGQNLNSSYCVTPPVYTNPSFVRGAPERRTDTFITNRSSYKDPEVIYRHPEKLIASTTLQGSPYNMRQTPIFQRGSLTRDLRNANPQPKRVSFEEQYLSKNALQNDGSKSSTNSKMVRNLMSSYPECSSDVSKVANGSKGVFKAPPRPPVRTSSVNRSYKMENSKNVVNAFGKRPGYSESESGSEAGEIQRILRNSAAKEEDWHGDGTRIDGGLSDGEASRGPVRGRTSRRDDPRRHTLAGNHFYIHPHHQTQISSLDIEPNGREEPNIAEYATVTKYRDREMKPVRILDPRMRKPPLPRYPPPNNALLFDDDPGIMSEVETASTGFRRGGKQRSSLPVVRTPSKTLERPLGLVFLQYRNETKRALLPNEITSIDTVKALFVRSFPKQLTMQYMDSPMVKIYIHDSSKDMFYELEDVRAHLRDIRDRSVLRLFEATDMGGGVFPGAVGVGSLAIPPSNPPCSGPSSWDQDQSYFSEPEIDSEYHHQHVHKSKVKAPAYYIGTSAPSTLPRGGSLLRAFSPAAAPVPADRAKTVSNTAPGKPMRSVARSGSERCFRYGPGDCTRPEQLYTIPGHGGEGYMSSPERGAARAPYEDPYYTQFLGPAGGRPTITPVIDEEASDGVLIDDSYQMYGVNALGTAPRPMPRPPYDARINPQVEDMQRLRVEKMERQLANLTGLVQKALQAPGAAAPVVAPRQEFQTYATRPTTQDGARYNSTERPPKLGRDKFQKSVSFEKSVSFSDDPPDMNSPIQHSPQHSERDRLKPAPPPKPAGLVGQQLALVPQRTYTINVSPDFFNQLRVLQKQSRDLRLETRNLRRSTLSHAIQMRQLMADTIVKIGAIAASFCEHDPESQLTREEEIYRQDMLLLENDLYELEATVERLRGQAANRETRVNMADIERIAMVLSKSSKTVADWKLKFPILQDTMKVKLASEMEKVVRKEKMLEEEPERLELALRRCKKLTGTLVTLKRLACVQEQRLPLTDGRLSPGSSQSSSFTAGPSSEEFTSDTTCHVTPAHNKGTGDACVERGPGGRGAAELRPENALDALLDELQTFAKPAERGERGERGEPPLRRLHSYPSGSDTDASPPVRARGQHPPKPPVPERHPELLALAQRRAPPPPPPRTTSRSPLASPTSPTSSPRADIPNHSNHAPPSDSPEDRVRQAQLEQRHQELLKKQKALQEQYARLQMIQRTGPTLPPNVQPDLKKTGSESNLVSKMNLNLAPAATSGSMTHLAGEVGANPGGADLGGAPTAGLLKVADPSATTNKVYETDIL
ncbi:coiled-coil domain-containing protein AGAP005037 isoform X4 [Pectinophora gossypiella]|uniref:coiled-coil domain-containing protein AGAP005037 isoform X4 n=1 Tax=Pectinophora gossypiella TaxID=13191 RepID=UPI00214E1D3B|nr:coiled-coil domain-containing protein AGAP005037 isoform X4 [Pectinophora gossypiella]